LESKSETAQRDDGEQLADPIDELMVAAYRTVVPGAAFDSTEHGARAAAHETTAAPELQATEPGLEQLKRQYQALISSDGAAPVAGYWLRQRLGQGGQGIVFAAQCGGADGYCNNVLAVKLFSPHRYPSVESYEKDMRRIAQVASIVAGIDQGNVLSVQRFDECRGIRMMVMKRILGYDLQELMRPAMLECVKHRDHELWEELNKVVAVPGPHQTRFRPGAAVALIRPCLRALDQLHSQGVVHGDVKPANLMISPEGEVKLVDTGSAFEWQRSPRSYFCTPRYAALEVLESGKCTPRSDLASLGYVLVELLTGRSVFATQQPKGPREICMPQEASTGIKPPDDPELANEKRRLPSELGRLLHSYSPRLVQLCRRLIDPAPENRFASAYDAELFAYRYIQELEQAELSCHFDNEFRLWLKAIRAAPESVV